MKPLFIKKNGTVSKVSGIIMNLIPSYTLAEYNALTHKPLFWVRTDEDYAQIPSEDVSYGSGSVKDVLDGLKLITQTITATSNSGGSCELGISSRSYTLLSCAETHGYKPVPFIYGNAWRVNVYDTTGTTLTAQVNTSCTFEVVYVAK